MRRVSFRVQQGQLCVRNYLTYMPTLIPNQVIVGFNGSGKSTILKLAARIYDVTEGTIRINGRDIREVKLDDLHRSIAVLFQDYTLFPLSVRPSISIAK